MKRLFRNFGIVMFIVTFVTISFCFKASPAEKKNFSMSTKREKWISENLLVPYRGPKSDAIGFPTI